MFERIGYGWELVGQSFRVLREDKRLIVFPMLSGIACLLVLAGFALPLWGTPEAKSLLDDKQVPNNAIVYFYLFAFYFVNYFVIVFFNSALVACAIIRFRGGTPTIGDGLAVALSRVPQIAGWALVSATIGLILKVIESRSERAGEVVSGLLGMAWSIVTYLVVPVLVVEKANPVQAFTRSASLLKKTWGESLTAHASTSMIFSVIGLIALLPLAIVVGVGVLGFANGLSVLVGFAIAATVVLLILISLVSSALSTILLAAIYLYAAEGTVPASFDREMIEGAFQRG